MTRGVGRPRTDRQELLELVERVAGHLTAYPDVPANEIVRREGGRRRDVLRLVKAIRGAMDASRTGAPESRFPNRREAHNARVTASDDE